MSASKEQFLKEKTVKGKMTLKIHPGGNTTVDFFPVALSGFVIDYVYGKKDRDRIAQTGSRKIYCG